MNPTQTLIGHCEFLLDPPPPPTDPFSTMTAHNGLFRIDPRVEGNKLVESQFKQYATKNDFSAATTTESGRVAVASNKGDIRLFDSIGKNAKVSYPESSARFCRLLMMRSFVDRTPRSWRPYYRRRRVGGRPMDHRDLQDLPLADRHLDWQWPLYGIPRFRQKFPGRLQTDSSEAATQARAFGIYGHGDLVHSGPI
jgi:hypothetical protein